MIIGICGSTGSGKTLFAKRLAEAIGREKKKEKCLIIQQDSYYIDRSHLTREEAERSNYDHPDAVDFALLEKHLKAFKEGRNIRIPCYDYATHRRTEAEKETAPKEIVILEGILIFHNAKIRELLDLKIFLLADEEVRISRRIERDVKERGRTRAEVIAQYFDTVQPMDRKFVIPEMMQADIIIPSDRENPLSVKIIAEHIRSLEGK